MTSRVGCIASGDALACTTGVSQAAVSNPSSSCGVQSRRRFTRPSLLVLQRVGSSRDAVGELACGREASVWSIGGLDAASGINGGASSTQPSAP